MNQAQKSSSFSPLGQIVITRQALKTLHRLDIYSALQRHRHCDWGECSDQDKKMNDLAAQEGFRVLSAYRDRNGTRFWIITEADRSATTVLLPEDY